MNEIKTLDEAGKSFIAKEEGIVLKPYKDSKGIPTIGIGCTFYPDGRKVTMKDKPLENTNAAWMLFEEVNKHFLFAIFSLTRDDITQNQFNALVSLCFNIGTGEQGFKGSTVLRLVNNNPNDPAIKEAFKMWRYTVVDGKKKPELLERRKREAELYFTK